MATIDSKRLIYSLIERDGWYLDDPRICSIWSYENSWGVRTQAVYWNELCDIFISPYVHKPKLLWSSSGGITEDGQAWMSAHRKEEGEEGEI